MMVDSEAATRGQLRDNPHMIGIARHVAQKVDDATG